MPFKEGQPTLTGVLSWIPLKHVVKERPFGGRYLRVSDYFTMLGFQYENCALLGRARCDKLNVLTRMLVREENKVEEFTKFLQNASSDRLNRFRNEVDEEPKSFYHFISIKEYDSVLVSAFGLPLDELILLAVRSRKIKEAKKLFDRKVPLEVATDKARIYGLEGIGFGSSFPELTERMYKNAYENVDMDMWAEARKMGVDIPEKPDIVSLEEREEIVLQMVAAYTSEFYPELLDPLNLRDYLVEGGSNNGV
jgi:hypothetical protein